MSWHYLQGQEVESWEGNSLDGAPSALLRLIPTPAAPCSQGRQTDALNRSPFGMTLRRSMGADGAEVLTWFRGDSPVRTYRQPEKEQDLTAQGLDCGPSSPESLAKCSPPSSGWKTRQCSLFGGLTEFSGTWPRWGMMRDGELSGLATPVLTTSAREYGWRPTPRKQLQDRKIFMRDTYKTNLEEWFGIHSPHLIGSRCDPNHVEWMMGWPIGWTDLPRLATDKFQQWLRSHGASSPQDFRTLEVAKA